MDNDKKQTDIKRARGRPPLSPDEKEQRRIENNKRVNEYHKANGYVAQRKYDEKNPIHKQNYNKELRLAYDELRVYLPKEHRAEFERCRAEIGLTISDFIIKALESCYGMTITKKD